MQSPPRGHLTSVSTITFPSGRSDKDRDLSESELLCFMTLPFLQALA